MFTKLRIEYDNIFQVASAVKDQDVDVVVLEGSPKIMSKVEKSGGGRCNVLHDTSKPVPVILDGYPRGKKELNGIMTKYFGPTQARRWFEKRGVELKTESDGRMVWLFFSCSLFTSVDYFIYTYLR